MAKTRSIVLGFILALGLQGIIQYTFDSHTNFTKDKDIFISLPSSSAARILSFGYENLSSDLLYIWAIQLYSTTYLSNRFDFLESIFNLITDLSPTYKDPYSIGALIMGFEKKDFDMAIRLLDKAMKNMPNEWIFPYEAGYYSYRYHKDYKKAEYYYYIASHIPNAPPLIRRQRFHMAYLQNNLREAWKMWMDLYQTSKDPIDKTSAYNHLYQIKNEMDIQKLEKAISLYQSQFNQFPRSLQELVEKKFISNLPKDFSGKDYLFDSKTGKVKPARLFKWKRSQ